MGRRQRKKPQQRRRIDVKKLTPRDNHQLLQKAPDSPTKTPTKSRSLSCTHVAPPQPDTQKTSNAKQSLEKITYKKTNNQNKDRLIAITKEEIIDNYEDDAAGEHFIVMKGKKIKIEITAEDITNHKEAKETKVNNATDALHKPETSPLPKAKKQQASTNTSPTSYSSFFWTTATRNSTLAKGVEINDQNFPPLIKT